LETCFVWFFAPFRAAVVVHIQFILKTPRSGAQQQQSWWSNRTL